MNKLDKNIEYMHGKLARFGIELSERQKKVVESAIAGAYASARKAYTDNNLKIIRRIADHHGIEQCEKCNIYETVEEF